MFPRGLPMPVLTARVPTDFNETDFWNIERFSAYMKTNINDPVSLCLRRYDKGFGKEAEKRSKKVAEAIVQLSRLQVWQTPELVELEIT